VKSLLQGDNQVPKIQPREQRDPAQPNLPFDGMPTRIEPALALLGSTPPKGDDWVKFDGYRIAVHIEPSGVSVITCGGHDWTDRFPTIAATAQKLGVGTAILDGEAVVLDDKGRSDFGALQRSLRRPREETRIDRIRSLCIRPTLLRWARPYQNRAVNSSASAE
jgi:bifunctional non-homologous end joining protein LigD